MTQPSGRFVVDGRAVDADAFRLVSIDPAIARPGPRLPALLAAACAEIDALGRPAGAAPPQR